MAAGWHGSGGNRLNGVEFYLPGKADGAAGGGPSGQGAENIPARDWRLSAMMFGVMGEERDWAAHLGGVEDVIDHPVLQVKVLLLDYFDETGSLGQGLKHELGIAFGHGGLGSLHGHFRGLAEPEIAALEEIIPELLLGPAHLGLQVGLVAVQGGSAEAVFLAESVKVADPATRAWSIS